MASINLIPEGWTTDPREMSYDAFWRSHDSPGQQIAREHGLKDTQPIMCTKRETRIPTFVFQAEKRFYIWDCIGGYICGILKPEDLSEILVVMGGGGIDALKTRDLEPVVAE
ncbi:uncharacterized protein ASPGLDRAFT_39082 [Aspergillus glaucus CBS 516.65]|uniref:Uncharacterized protein n=1 Tax=Aspergillus glaucus CBS 516.65 TaxID=1160497 RepID=A0A1L9V8Y2_ASPGL|nr:hypothetical protein ASPGLDRAFT_39082 [Aspergillus glaucus CBS 516.65]OJJ80388.1 hypothetical protein ASPGLDRAFT_39082 [Aspergillus glaucus CBS 516.65]